MLVAYATNASPFSLSKLKFQCGSVPQGMYLDRSEAVMASPFPFDNNTFQLSMRGHRGKLQRLWGEVFLLSIVYLLYLLYLLTSIFTYICKGCEARNWGSCPL